MSWNLPKAPDLNRIPATCVAVEAVVEATIYAPELEQSIVVKVAHPVRLVQELRTALVAACLAVEPVHERQEAAVRAARVEVDDDVGLTIAVQIAEMDGVRLAIPICWTAVNAASPRDRVVNQHTAGSRDEHSDIVELEAAIPILRLVVGKLCSRGSAVRGLHHPTCLCRRCLRTKPGKAQSKHDNERNGNTRDRHSSPGFRRKWRSIPQRCRLVRTRLRVHLASGRPVSPVGVQRYRLLAQSHGFEGLARGSVEEHSAHPSITKLIDPPQSLIHVDSTSPRAKADTAEGYHPVVSRLAHVVKPRLETLKVLPQFGEPGPHTVVPSVWLTGKRTEPRVKLHVVSGVGKQELPVARSVGREHRLHDLHVLLRNSRSPRRVRHWFQRNSLPEALELAHQALGDALVVF